jgi:AcrR family transcriptional regulator
MVHGATELHFAAKQFFDRGFVAATLGDIVTDARSGGVSISESTLLRRYRTKAGLFAAVMDVAAGAIRSSFVERVTHKGQNIRESEPRLLALTYVTTVLEMWASDGPDKWHVGLVFGRDSLPYGEIERASTQLFSEGAMADLRLLDSILLRACAGDARAAMNLSCLLIGSIEEFVFAAAVKGSVYARQYDPDGLVFAIDVLLDAFVSKLRPYSAAATGRGDSLMAVAASLRAQADALDRLAVPDLTRRRL